MHSTNYIDTFITIAPDSSADHGTVPPERPTPSVAQRQFRMIAQNPYRYTSDEVIFAVWADRNEIPEDARDQARAEFFSKGQPCLRSSDLGKRYGWGVHSDGKGRVAIVGVDTLAYATLADGRTREGEAVTVVQAMRSKR